MDTRMIFINPLAVEECLKLADFEYPFNRMADFSRGWARFPVIPNMFQKVCEVGRPLRPDEGIRFLMDNCDPRYKNDETVLRRGQKLYFDASRDIHTLGLLMQCPILATVLYQKALDLSMNIDYLATLLRSKNNIDQVAIQAAMRGRWQKDDPYERVKRERRSHRRYGQSNKWQGPIFWLTNKFRPPNKKINKCWLFGPAHIYDLSETIKSKLEGGSNIAIQTRMFD